MSICAQQLLARRMRCW